MTSRHRFYTSEAPIGEQVVITGSEAHHMLRALRLGPGNKVIIFNGDGNDYIGKLVKAEKGVAEIRIEDVQPNRRKPLVDVTLGVAVCKGRRIEMLVQQCAALMLLSALVYEYG